MISAKEIIQRAGEADNERRQIQPYIDIGYKYAIPWRKDASRGSIMQSLMDATGPKAVAGFSARLATSLIPPEGKFFELRAGDLIQYGDPRDVEAADKKNEFATNIVHSMLRGARIDLALQEMCQDLALSTGAMFMRQGDMVRSIMEVCAVPSYQLNLELGANNMHCAWFWEREITGRQLKENYPQNDKWPPSLKTKVEKNEGEKHKILQATIWNSQEKLYQTFAVIDNYILDQTEQRASPWITPRYWAMPSFAWGIGPLLLALPDIRTLNKNVELLLRAAALALAPPMMVADDGVINPDALVIGEHSLIRVSRTGGGMFGDPIKPLQLGGRVDLGQMQADDMRARVKETLLDVSLPPETGAVRSPTEIIKREQQEQQLTLGAFGRLQRECLEPIVARCIDIADRLKIPGVVWEQNRPDYYLNKVKITTPMARAVEQGDATNFMNYLQILANIGGQELTQLMVDLEAQAPWLADMMGVPANRIRPSDEREKVKQAAIEGAQAIAQQEQQNLQMQMAQKTGQKQLPPPPDSEGAMDIPLDLMGEA